MALLDILIFPDQRLKQIAEPIQKIDDEIKKMANDMLETMYNAEGIGLAATQVNIHMRMIVMDVSENKNSPLCLINPVIVKHSGILTWQEGCLSFPGIYTKVKRHETISLEYQDFDNKTQVLNTTGLLSICIQHELDHINGITFYDRISPLRQTLIRKKIKALSKNIREK